jgi:16S rRNA (guanine966-N2)-methyltransferase
MRVIAGQYRSRLLKSLKGVALRPTSDYMRETLFNVLGPDVAGSHFLDLFAGTGAVGIEALSRGAASATFIESHRPAIALIKANLASLQITSGAIVIASDALRALESLVARRPAPQFDYIYLDPPYAAAIDYNRILTFLGSAMDTNNSGRESPPLLKPASMVIAEHRRTFSLSHTFGALHHTRTITHGDASLSFYLPQ